MAQWWLGYVQGGKTTKLEGEHPGGDREQPKQRILKQFYVQREIERLGVECYLPQRMEFKRTGKNRRAEPYVSPTLPNYIFINTPPETFYSVLGVKYLGQTLMALRRDDIAALGLFRERNDRQYAEAEQIVQNQDAFSEYEIGQRLEAIEGGFKDSVLTFKRMVDRANDLYPKVQAEMEMMGRFVTVEFDPLNVRAAE